MPTSLHSRGAELVRQGKLAEAFDLLRNEPAGSEVDELRSLLGRLLGQSGPGASGTPSLGADSGSVPRRTLSSHHPAFALESFPHAVAEMCFVTAATSDYLSLALGCIGSIEACSRFENATLVVFDCGLDRISRDTLEHASSRVTVVPLVEYDWFWRDVCGGSGRLASIFCRAFLRELIDDARYYFWIDADAWIQDEGGLAEYLTVAMRQGLSVPIHPFGRAVSRDSHWIRRNTLTALQVDCVVGHRALIACCFCVDAASESYSSFCDTVRNNLRALGPKWGMDQEVLLYTVARMGLTLLPTEYAFEGSPFLYFDATWSHLLFADIDKPVQVYHVGGGLQQAHRKLATEVTGRHQIDSRRCIELRTPNRYLVPTRGDVAAVMQRLQECCSQHDG